MTIAQPIIASFVAMACVLLQPSSLAASQTIDRQASERWERKPGEFEEYRSFLGRFEGDDDSVSQASSKSRHKANNIDRLGHAVVDQEETPLTTVKTVAIKTIKIAGQVVKTVAIIVVGSAMLVGYLILESQRQFPRSSY